MKGSAVSNGRSTEQERAAASPLDTHGLSREDLLRAYRTMVLSRRLDDKEIQLKNQSLIFFQISGAGHEAVLVAAGMQLKPSYDWFYPYYRDRALCLAVGMTSLEMLLAAVGSKDDPASGGRQMPSHWGHKQLNIVSSSSPTGTQCLQAIGCAEASLLYEKNTAIDGRESRFHRDEVTYVSTGEGATSEGEFWESLNSACLGRVPVVYLVEDNGYAISVPVEVQTAGGDISKLVSSFPGLFVQSIDGTDFLASYRAMSDAIAYARARKGPALVHAKVIRPYSHSLSDDEKFYKTSVERAEESTRDPIVKLAEFLKAERFATDDELATIRQDVDREVNDAADRAVQAPKPSPDTVALYVCSPDVDPTGGAFSTPPAPEGRPDTMVAAINRTLKDEMARDPRIVVFGEDVADCSRADALASVSGKGGVFKVTHGLQRTFGSDRVFNSPLAEANIIGRATGMATRGLKPVVEIQFFDYIWPAMMQIRDELTMLRYRSNNAFSCPIVIRVPIGGYLQRRRALPQPVRREHLRALSWHPDRLPLERAGRRRPVADVDQVRRPGALSRAQASLPSDLQQGRVPRRQLHGPVRESGRTPRGRGRCRPHVGRAGAAVAPRRATGRERRDRASWSSTCERSCRSIGRRSRRPSQGPTGS